MNKVTKVYKIILVFVFISTFMMIDLIRPRAIKAEEDNLPSRFNLKEVLEKAGTPLVLKNQYSYGACPHMAQSSMIEAHVKYRKSQGKYDFITETPVYSVIACYKQGSAISIDNVEPLIREYSNGEIQNEDELLSTPDIAFNDELQEMVRTRTKPQISTPDSDGKSSGYVISPSSAAKSIYKRYEDGILKYYDAGFKSEITKEEAESRRKDAKQFILDNGAIKAGVSTSGFRDGKDGKKVCNAIERPTDTGGHAIIIVGWDDNYPKENFPEDCRPSENGAWIAQNSWGTWGGDGVFYISYEDVYAEDDLFGIKELVPYEDTNKPMFTIDEDKSNFIVKVESYSDIYGSGIDMNSFKYKIVDYNIDIKDDVDGWIGFNPEDEIKYKKGQYVWLKVSDKAGNTTIRSTGDNSTPMFYKFKNDYEEGKRSEEDVVITFYDIAAEMLGDDPQDYIIHYYCNTISPEEFSQMEKINEDKTHTLTINKNGKHHIIAGVYDEDSDEDYRCFEFDVWIDKQDQKQNQDEEQEKEKQTDENKEQSTTPEKKNDNSVADKVIPNTGSRCIVLFIVIGLSMFVVYSYKKCKKIYR